MGIGSTVALVALASAVASGCGAGSAAGGGTNENGAAGPVDDGDPMATPSLVSLPSLDVPRDSLSDKMRFGWDLADESFDHERPPSPPSGQTVDYQAWAGGDLASWLERKTRTVEAARAELDQAAEENPRQRILAGAIVGLMYESVGRELLRLPIPGEIQTDQEIADVFRSILASQARPYLAHARRAFDACRQNATGGPEGLRHWSEYCAARLDYLPAEE
jgi:hypothetical protein